jgi:hypothetical protein
MDPLTIGVMIASALASAYSTQQQASAQRKIQDQQALAAQAERMRQRALDAERTATVKSAIPELSPESQTEERDTIARNLEQYLAPKNERTAAEAEFADRANPGAPKEIGESRERALAGAVSKGADYAKNLARMSALKNLNFNNALSINRLGTDVGELSTQASRSASLLPYELEAANAAGNAATTRASAAQGLPASRRCMRHRGRAWHRQRQRQRRNRVALVSSCRAGWGRQRVSSSQQRSQKATTYLVRLRRACGLLVRTG